MSNPVINNQEKKICPIFSAPMTLLPFLVQPGIVGASFPQGPPGMICVKEKCAWWDPDIDQCAVHSRGKK